MTPPWQHAGLEHDVLARRDQAETLVLGVNRHEQTTIATVPTATLDAQTGKTLVPLLGEEKKIDIGGNQVSIPLSTCSAMALSLT